jgi:hypothetical protein
VEKLMESNQEFAGFGSIWDWLLENGGAKRPTAPPEPPSEEIEPTHCLTDDDLLALEREAEMAAKMRCESDSASPPAGQGPDV